MIVAILALAAFSFAYAAVTTYLRGRCGSDVTSTVCCSMTLGLTGGACYIVSCIPSGSPPKTPARLAACVAVGSALGGGFCLLLASAV